MLVRDSWNDVILGYCYGEVEEDRGAPIVQGRAFISFEALKSLLEKAQQKPLDPHEVKLSAFPLTHSTQGDTVPRFLSVP